MQVDPSTEIVRKRKQIERNAYHISTACRLYMVAACKAHSAILMGQLENTHDFAHKANTYIEPTCARSQNKRLS